MDSSTGIWKHVQLYLMSQRTEKNNLEHRLDYSFVFVLVIHDRTMGKRVSMDASYLEFGCVFVT